jgi:hypothetical protein
MCKKSLARACAGGLMALAPLGAQPIAFANGATFMAQYGAVPRLKVSPVLP